MLLLGFFSIVVSISILLGIPDVGYMQAPLYQRALAAIAFVTLGVWAIRYHFRLPKSDEAYADGPWPIDVEKLRQSALELEAVAKQCAKQSAYVRTWYQPLEDLVAKAKAGQITTTLKDLPGSGFAFTYDMGDLDKFPQLHLAYARFYAILEYGESEDHKRALERTRKIVREMDEEEFGKDFKRPEKDKKL